MCVGVEREATFSTLTVNGSATGVTLVTTSTFADSRAELYYLKAPPTGAFNVVYTISSAARKMTLGVVSFSGVDQTTPLGTAATAGKGRA